METRPFYHDGMREMQDIFDGRRLADLIPSHVKHYDFTGGDRTLIEGAQFFFIATSYRDYVDCSIKAGDPGFVKITAPGTIEYPEYDGNSMYRTLGNIRKNPNAGLLFIRFDGASMKMRVNGFATLHDDAESLSRHYGAKLVVRIACEIYPNCPRYAPDLERGKPSIYPPRPGEQSPVPDWKRLEGFGEALPASDPHREEISGAARAGEV